MYILQLQNITKKYPGVVALNDVSLDVTKGEAHALVGENGAGKSTLIKTCTGAVVPDNASERGHVGKGSGLNGTEIGRIRDEKDGRLGKFGRKKHRVDCQAAGEQRAHRP